jgi:hypothetical protein
MKKWRISPCMAMGRCLIEKFLDGKLEEIDHKFKRLISLFKHTAPKVREKTIVSNRDPFKGGTKESCVLFICFN